MGGPTPIPWQERIIPEPNSGCWLWTGTVSSFGHGNVRIRGKLYQPHRLAWEEANGPIPPGLWVLHRCDVPSCCNPDHLFLGTNRDNMVDMVTKGRGVGGLNRQKTHCPQGHAYTEANTFTHRGIRYCKRCHADRQSVRQRRQRQERKRLTPAAELFTCGGMEKEVTYIRLDPATKRALERIAASDERPLSALLRKIIADWLKAHKASK